MLVARPLDEEFDYRAERFTVACTVSGRTEVFLIAWWARSYDEAEEQFQKWLSKGWAMMSRTFFNERCRYVFRPGAVNGFIVLPPRTNELLDDDW